jgi:hypothetical protein
VSAANAKEVTKAAAEAFARLSLSLRQHGADPVEAAHFLVRMLLCMVAQNIGATVEATKISHCLPVLLLATCLPNLWNIEPGLSNVEPDIQYLIRRARDQLATPMTMQSMVR